MQRRTLTYVAVGAVLLAGAWLLTKGPPSSTSLSPRISTAPTATTASSAGGAVPVPTTTATPLRIHRPPSSEVELGVLTAMPEDALGALVQRESLAALVTGDLCGEQAACDAVRSTLRDEHATTVTVADAAAWKVDALDAGSPADRAAARKMPRVVVVKVATATGPKQLAVRAAFAAAAAVARKAGGLVWDRLLDRVEPANAFAAHAVTSPLEAPCFRRDRVAVRVQPKAEGTARVVTVGLSRWGAPDVDAAAVPTTASARIEEIVLGVAEALANGATEGPLVLTRDDLARARGQAYAADAGLPEVKPVEVDVVGVHPEPGDASDFVARVEPPGGDGPIAYVDLAERFFGPLLIAPAADADGRREKAQAQLAAALAAWDAAKERGAKLVVALPFAIPGDAGAESVWVEVTRFDARTVTGKVLDDPLGATDVKRGDEVTRPRAQVQGVDLRGASP